MRVGGEKLQQLISQCVHAIALIDFIDYIDFMGINAKTERKLQIDGVDPELMKALRHMAVERETTLRVQVIAALRMYLGMGERSYLSMPIRPNEEPVDAVRVKPKVVRGRRPSEVAPVYGKQARNGPIGPPVPHDIPCKTYGCPICREREPMS